MFEIVYHTKYQSSLGSNLVIPINSTDFNVQSDNVIWYLDLTHTSFLGVCAHRYVEQKQKTYIVPR